MLEVQQLHMVSFKGHAAEVPLESHAPRVSELPDTFNAINPESTVIVLEEPRRHKQWLEVWTFDRNPVGQRQDAEEVVNEGAPPAYLARRQRM